MTLAETQGLKKGIIKMATKIRPVSADERGLAKWLERESQTMHPLQFFREALQNEIEAGATKIVIDGFQASTGHLLTRVSGNGSGMTPQKLISHLATVMITDKGEDNYGVGARIAALPANPAGVTFASKTAKTAGMISIIKSNGIYGLRTWTIGAKDEDGDAITLQEEVITPSPGVLSQVKDTGTAVILHGDGKSPTWNDTLAHKVHNYLVKRFYQFPGNVHVSVSHSDNKKHVVVPFGNSLADWAVADGEVPFRDIAGLSGVMFWWLLPKREELNNKISGHNNIGAGIGLVVNDEIFDYSQSYMTDFGIQYKSVQARVVMLIGIDGAKMDTSRSTVVYPTSRATQKRNTPWKALGAYFSEHMPAAIDELMSKAIPAASIFTEDAAKKLDPDWMKWIKPVPIVVPKKEGSPSTGDDNGDALPPGKSYDDENDPGPPPNNPQPDIAAHRQNAGDKPGVTKLKTVTPKVEFVPAEEMPESHPYIFWAETNNTIMISRGFPPYVREVKRWIEKTDHPKSFVETAVQQAYSIEYAAYIVDSNAQRAAQMVPADIEQLKSDLSLYGKALGCQSLTEMIAQYLKATVKNS
jgi:hypothetical protein